MKTTAYFSTTRTRPDRIIIQDEWICRTITNPEISEIQSDGRIRFWRKIEEANNRWLRVITLEDGQTIHNAFFDRKKGGQP